MSAKSCADAIVGLMESYGIDTIFGIPGVHTVAFYRGLAASGLRHVTPRHEQGASLMAYGYALASGRPAACSVITGPGLLNATTGIGQAYSDSVPMLVVAAANKSNELAMGQGFLHEMPDQHDAARTVTAFNHQLRAPENLPEIFAQAFARFDSSRPRPVGIEVPRDLFDTPCDIDISAWPRTPKPAPDSAAIAEAAKLLSEASAPVILLGGGAKWCGPQALELAGKTGAMIVTTTAAKGAVPETHALSAGATLELQATQKALADADLVLAAGTELAETSFWAPTPEIRLGRRLIRVDIDPAQLVRSFRPDVSILGDAKMSLEALSRAFTGAPSADGAGRAARLREENLAGHEVPVTANRRRMLDLLAQYLPENCFVSLDSTQVAYTGASYFRIDHPNGWHFPNGFGTLGTGVPTAIGAKLGVPDRPVMAIAGDGGLLFTAEELIVAAELRLPIPVVVWNNGGYGEIRDHMIGAGVQPLGTDLLVPDFSALAKGYRCAYACPESGDAFGRALGEAFTAAGPTLIELRSDAAFLNG
ncbi:5-guanidino-2-oxopentanoate decarboxylase [Nisaea acidiphila]|uniref:5-guanidino-2-oxopentanoate decarboxylase n=1 Tax=Nisaea acidiphila TaxID=1862145 RepID=A0A9J7AVZ5_9PROT|nr:5-guanidino-2-oxopentanoate decarboxylase [Nisaea acidiphila]UUX51294.1 5-guanidino-2-oxopentanoate decarboxylase [Nisaea acidiphila]